MGATAASAGEGNELVIGNKGTSIIGPRNGEREQQNPDILRRPSTDHGNMPNLKLSFADANMEIRDGGGIPRRRLWKCSLVHTNAGSSC
jgi:oxalate decarboxylase